MTNPEEPAFETRASRRAARDTGHHRRWFGGSAHSADDDLTASDAGPDEWSSADPGPGGSAGSDWQSGDWQSRQSGDWQASDWRSSDSSGDWRSTEWRTEGASGTGGASGGGYASSSDYGYSGGSAHGEAHGESGYGEPTYGGSGYGASPTGGTDHDSAPGAASTGFGSFDSDDWVPYDSRTAFGSEPAGTAGGSTPASSSYEAPSHGAPSYGSSSYEAPSYDAPSYETRSYETPSYGAPSYGEPAYGSSAFGAADYGSTSYSTPSDPSRARATESGEYAAAESLSDTPPGPWLSGGTEATTVWRTDSGAGRLWGTDGGSSDAGSGGPGRADRDGRSGSDSGEPGPNTVTRQFSVSELDAELGAPSPPSVPPAHEPTKRVRRGRRFRRRSSRTSSDLPVTPSPHPSGASPPASFPDHPAWTGSAAATAATTTPATATPAVPGFPSGTPGWDSPGSGSAPDPIFGQPGQVPGSDDEATRQFERPATGFGELPLEALGTDGGDEGGVDRNRPSGDPLTTGEVALPPLVSVVRPLVPGATLALAFLIAVSAFASPIVLAGSLGLAGLVLAWGWPSLLGSPSRVGSSTVLAISTVVSLGVVVSTTDEPLLRLQPVAIAASVLAMFLHQLLRRDGRPRLTESVAISGAGIAVLASGTTLVALPSTFGSGRSVAIMALAVGFSALLDLKVDDEKVRPWLLPLSMAVGAVVGFALAVTMDRVQPGAGMLIGVATAGTAHATRRILAVLPPIASVKGQLTSAAASILVPGVVTYVLARLLVL